MRTVSENEAELVARSPAPDTTDVTSGQSDCFILAVKPLKAFVLYIGYLEFREKQLPDSY